MRRSLTFCAISQYSMQIDAHFFLLIFIWLGCRSFCIRLILNLIDLLLFDLLIISIHLVEWL